MDAKKIWSYARRLLAIIPSIFICALGVALLVWPEWGCDPLTTFEIGLSNVFHVQFGTVALVFEGIMFFVFFFVRRDLVHLGTLAWCFLMLLQILWSESSQITAIPVKGEEDRFY